MKITREKKSAKRANQHYRTQLKLPALKEEKYPRHTISKNLIQTKQLIRLVCHLPRRSGVSSVSTRSLPGGASRHSRSYATGSSPNQDTEHTPTHPTCSTVEKYVTPSLINN